MLVTALLLAHAGATIQILDPDGHPITGAKVVPFRFVSYTNPQPFPALVADAQGVVDMSGPSERPHEVSSVVAFEPGFGAAWSTYGRPVPVTLRLAPETVLHVTVHANDGSIVPNVVLRPTWLADKDGATRIPLGLSRTWLLKTDEKGVVVMPGLPRGARLVFENLDPRFVREPTGVSPGTDRISNGELRLKAVIRLNR